MESKTNIFSSAFEKMINLAEKDENNKNASFCEINKQTIDTVKLDKNNVKIIADVRCYKIIGKNTFKRLSKTTYSCDARFKGKSYVIEKCKII